MCTLISGAQFHLFSSSPQGAVVLVKAAASSSCKLQQLQMHGCGIADMGFIQGAIKLRAEEALANAKGPKKKAKKKKKGGKAKEEPAGEPLNCQHDRIAQLILTHAVLHRHTSGGNGQNLQACTKSAAAFGAQASTWSDLRVYGLTRDAMQSAIVLEDTSELHYSPNGCHATQCCLTGVVACCLT